MPQHEPHHENKHHQNGKHKVERKESKEFKPDPDTFEEKFKGFDEDPYEDVIQANNEFFKDGYTKYVENVKEGKYFNLYNAQICFI